jgi:hypothetical protein
VKKFLTVLFVLTIACSFVMAEGLGLEVGADFTLADVTDVFDSSYILTPHAEYANSFGAIDVDVYLEYPVGFGTADEELYQTPYLEEEMGYKLSLGAASTLSLILNNSNNFYLSPDIEETPGVEETNKLDGSLEPGVKFNQTFGFGDLYAQAGFPIGYLSQEKDADITIDSYLLLGFAHGSGFGAELTFNLALSPEGEYTETELLFSYEADAIYAELDIVTDKEFSSYTVTPEVEYSLNALTLWADIEFAGIGEDDIIISPTVGVKYSF